MSLARLMDTPVTIIHAGTVPNSYGGTDLDWTDEAVTTADTLCWFNDISSSEVIDGRDALISVFHLYLPADTAIEGIDRVLIAGTLYEVDGPISTAGRPQRGVHHLECHLRLVEG